MAVSHTLIVAAVLSSLLVCGRADLCAPACRGGSDVFPHPQDCTSFYQCSSGSAFLQHCPAGLEFNPIGHYCDYPAHAGCTSDATRDCEVADPSQELIKCIPDCFTNGDFYPDPRNCAGFFKCSQRQAQYMLCVPPKLYSPLFKSCVHPRHVNCTANAESPCLANETPNICAPKCPFAGVYLAHPQDCTKFYTCGANAMPFEMSCQPGLIYDMKLRQCDYPEKAYCVASPDRACDERLGK